MSISCFIFSGRTDPKKLPAKQSVVRVELNLRALYSADAPEDPILLFPSLSVVRVELDLSTRLNAKAPKS